MGENRRNWGKLYTWCPVDFPEECWQLFFVTTINSEQYRPILVKSKRLWVRYWLASIGAKKIVIGGYPDNKVTYRQRSIHCGSGQNVNIINASGNQYIC